MIHHFNQEQKEICLLYAPQIRSSSAYTYTLREIFRRKRNTAAAAKGRELSSDAVCSFNI